MRRLWLFPTLVGGALRLLEAQRLYHAWLIAGNRGEGYYDGAVNFLGYRVLAEQVPVFGPSGARGPLYGAFMVLVESFFSAPHPGHILVAQALLSTLAIVVAYELGAAIASPWAGLLAAAWMALDVAQIEAVGRLDLHAFYAYSILALAAAAAAWLREPTPKRGAALAVAFAASITCRSGHFAFPIALGAFALAPRSGVPRRAVLLAAGLAALFLALPIAANSLRFGRLVPLDAGPGSTRFYATTEDVPCCEVKDFEPRRRELLKGSAAATPAEEDAAIIAAALQNIRHQPLRFARGWAANFLDFWKPYWRELALGAGAAFALSAQPGFRALAATLLSFLGYHLLVLYRVHSEAVLPLLSVAAGLGLACLHRPLGRRVLSQQFFNKPRDSGHARTALLSVFAVSYAAVLCVFAAEAWARRSKRIVLATGDPSASAHRAPLRYLDLVVANTRGRAGLQERARVHAGMGHYELACADLARLARQEPSRADFARKARKCAAARERSPGMLLRWKRWALLRPGPPAQFPFEEPSDWTGLAGCDADDGPDHDACVEAFPRNASYRQNRAVARYRRGDLDGAEVDFRAALAADHAFAPAAISLAALLLESGRTREALPLAETAVLLTRSGPAQIREAALSQLRTARAAARR